MTGSVAPGAVVAGWLGNGSGVANGDDGCVVTGAEVPLRLPAADGGMTGAGAERVVAGLGCGVGITGGGAGVGGGGVAASGAAIGLADIMRCTAAGSMAVTFSVEALATSR